MWTISSSFLPMSTSLFPLYTALRYFFAHTSAGIPEACPGSITPLGVPSPSREFRDILVFTLPGMAMVTEIFLSDSSIPRLSKKPCTACLEAEYAERSGIVGFTGSFEPSNVATLRLHRRLGDAVVTEQGEGRYVAYFAGGTKSGDEEPDEGTEAPAPRKTRKAPKKRAGRQRKENSRGGR